MSLRLVFMRVGVAKIFDLLLVLIIFDLAIFLLYLITEDLELEIACLSLKKFVNLLFAFGYLLWKVLIELRIVAPESLSLFWPIGFLQLVFVIRHFPLTENQLLAPVPVLYALHIVFLKYASGFMLIFRQFALIRDTDYRRVMLYLKIIMSDFSIVELY